MDTASLKHHGTFVALAAVLFLTAPSFALAATGNVNFFLGAKILNDDDWAPLENQGEIGAEVTFGGNDWPIHIAIDVFGSGTEETEAGIDFEGTTGELDFGVRKIWELKRIRPYVGGGIALVTAEFKGTDSWVTISDDDNGAGAWVGGGIFW